MVTSDKMELARRVVDEVNRLTPKDDLYLEAYANGREQGYSIMNFRGKEYRRVAFSEFRRSDDLVVYFGKHTEFSMQGNVPSDKVYTDARFFDSNKIGEAAQAIVAYLLEK